MTSARVGPRQQLLQKQVQWRDLQGSRPKSDNSAGPGMRKQAQARDICEKRPEPGTFAGTGLS